MNARFSKLKMQRAIGDKMFTAMRQYREATGTEYDPANGYAQVPIGNRLAFMYYGQIDALESLLEDI